MPKNGATGSRKGARWEKYPRTINPSARAIIAKTLAMKAIPMPAIGSPLIPREGKEKSWLLPRAPRRIPNRRLRPFFPPSSPAIRAWAVAMPGGQDPVAGKSSESKAR